MTSDQAARARAVLAQIRHLDHLPAGVLDKIASISSLHHFDAENVIYLEGEPAEAVYILERGWVKAARISCQGREQAMMFLRPVEIFGDVAVLTGQPYPATVTALEPVSVWVLPAQAVMQLVASQPALAQAIIRRLGERVLYYAGLVEDVTLRSVEARLAKMLLQNAQVHQGKLIVPRREWTTFDEMAVRLGTVRDVLSRALKALEADALLQVGKHEIVLLDEQRLVERGNS